MADPQSQSTPGGRPTKYEPRYCQEILEYFDVEAVTVRVEKFYYKNGDEKEKEIEVAACLPTFEGFAKKLGVSRETLWRWTEDFPDFCNAYTRAKEMQEEIWKINALKGLYNAQFSIFLGKNVFGYKDKTEQDTNLNVKEIGKITVDGKEVKFNVGN